MQSRKETEVQLLQEESKESDTKGQVQAIIDALDAQVAQWVLYSDVKALPQR